MTTSTSVVEVFSKLVSYEESVLGSLEDPNTVPDMSTDLLDNLSTEDIEQILLSRVGLNSTIIDSSLQSCLDVALATKRELSIRSKSRSDYYVDAGEQISDEISRLIVRKINTQQYLLGNTSVQRK